MLKTRALLPWQRNLAQLGNIDDWGYYRTKWYRSFAPPYLTTPYAYDWQELLDGLDMKALQSPQGVPFSSLPDELQQEIRRATSWEIKHDAIRATALAQRAEGDWKLHVRPNNYPTEFSIKFLMRPFPTDSAHPL